MEAGQKDTGMDACLCLRNFWMTYTKKKGTGIDADTVIHDKSLDDDDKILNAAIHGGQKYDKEQKCN